MKKYLVALALPVFAGCTSTENQVEHSYLYVNNGADVIEAEVKNPFPECETKLSIAKLDEQPEMQVFIDTDNGKVCK